MTSMAARNTGPLIDRLPPLARAVLSALAAAAVCAEAGAEPVRNGNEMALSYVTNTPAGKIVQARAVTGMFHNFRYLKVIGIQTNDADGKAATVTAVEPSSDIIVRIAVNTPMSMAIVQGLKTGECVACKGRVKSLGTVQPNVMVLDPAVINYKDRAGPKLTKELRREIDPPAY